MIKQINKINDKNKIFSLLTFIILIVYYLFYLNNSFHFPSLGSDELITVWPYRNFVNSENLLTQIYNFGGNTMYEDHIFLTLNIFSSLIPFDDFDPLMYIKKLNLFFFCTSIFILLKIGNYIFKNKTYSFLFCMIILFNKSLIYEHISYFYSYTLALFFQLLNFYYLLKTLKKFKYKYLVIFFIFNFLGTFVYENFFLYFIFEFAFCLSYFFFNRNKEVFKIIFFIYLKSGISFLSYIVIHFIKYDNFLVGYGRPYDSLSTFLTSAYGVTYNLLDDILYGIPSLFYNQKLIFVLILVFLIILVLIKVNLKKFELKYYHIFFSVILMGVGILYTGRYDPGLWSFFNILVTLIIFKFIFELNILKKNNFVIICISIIFLSFFLSPSKRLIVYSGFKNLKSNFDNSIFELLDKNKFNKLDLRIVTKNPTLTKRVIELWRLVYGIDTFYGGRGLYFYENERSYWPKNFEFSRINTKNSINLSNQFQIKHSQNKLIKDTNEAIYVFDNFVTKTNDARNFKIRFFINENNAYLIDDTKNIYKDLEKEPILNENFSLNIKKIKDYFKIDSIHEISLKLENNLNLKNLNIKINGDYYDTKRISNDELKLNIPRNTEYISLHKNKKNFTNSIKNLEIILSKNDENKLKLYNTFNDVILNRYEFVPEKYACMVDIKLDLKSKKIYKYKSIIEKNEKITLTIYEDVDLDNSIYQLIKLNENFKEISKVKFKNFSSQERIIVC